MAVANTYTEPTTGTSLNTARTYFNDSMRAVLTNFKGPEVPTQIKADDITIGEQDGMLYRSTKTNALYISDSANKQAGNIGGGFTRWGIGHRIEPTTTALTTNAAAGLYEKGELVVTLDTAKLYVKNGTSNDISAFTDVASSAINQLSALSAGDVVLHTVPGPIIITGQSNSGSGGLAASITTSTAIGSFTIAASGTIRIVAGFSFSLSGSTSAPSFAFKVYRNGNVAITATSGTSTSLDLAVSAGDLITVGGSTAGSTNSSGGSAYLYLNYLSFKAAALGIWRL